ncbi:hypothetical protein BD309DRAFT_536026 [Dichomitus squalens]|nr:hypothetical protein BD309DRAFT_536026 [Dichomitus squalens]
MLSAMPALASAEALSQLPARAGSYAEHCAGQSYWNIRGPEISIFATEQASVARPASTARILNFTASGAGTNSASILAKSAR